MPAWKAWKLAPEDFPRLSLLLPNNWMGENRTQKKLWPVHEQLQDRLREAELNEVTG